MDQGPPPPPPPHGENPRTTNGAAHPKYEIFMIPEHSAGAGFLYLPSLKPNTNSFIAGFASALMCVVVIQSLKPAIQQWWAEFQGMGNMGMMMLVVAVGLGAWAFGRQQADSTNGDTDGAPGNQRRRGPFESTGGSTFGGGPGAYSSTPPPPPPRSAPPPQQQAPPPHNAPPPHQHAPPPNNHYQAPPRPPEPEPPKPSAAPRANPPKSAWEKAREETRKREEERKAREADQKRKDDAARRLRELREKEAREREQREKDKLAREQREKEAKEREAMEKERLVNETRLREQREKELRDRLERERLLREKMEREAKEVKEKLERERREREAKEKEEGSQARAKSTYAYSAVGERTSMWPNGRPPAASSQPSTPRAPPSATSTSATPTKRPPNPTAKSTAGTEDEYSYRPYDKPKRPVHKKSVSDFSETSWAPSQSTARTTPPPSMRSPYTTKDPDKIVIRAVYCFLNQFAKTPASQLISGQGTVTDGLILRITTEGLFIDDDVRMVPQREWDVKAWTLKLVEVWCPTHSSNPSAISASASSSGSTPATHSFFKSVPSRRTDKGASKIFTEKEADAFLVEMLHACRGSCAVGDCSFTNAAARENATASSGSRSSVSGISNVHKTGDWKAKGLHLLRATLRDQEGKRYLFVLSEEESWKVAVGLKRLKDGSQTRALGVSSMGQLEVKNVLETLNW